MNLSHFRQLDWDFPGQNSKVFLHNLCWYPSRFIPIIPAQLINALSKTGDTVLDPFGGSGTTLVESLRLHRNAISVDSNPLSCFITKTKARIYSGMIFDENALLDFSTLLDLKDDNLPKQTTVFPPPLMTKRHFYNKYGKTDILNELLISSWYHPNTFIEMKSIYNYIAEVHDSNTKEILKIIFISILMSASGHRAGRPYTYYADNVKPKEPIQKDAYKQFSLKLKRFIKEFNTAKHSIRNKSNWQVFCDNTEHISNLDLPPVDLIVTSPPYLSVVDYNMAFRLAHLWFDWSTQLPALRKIEIGARYDRRKNDSTQKYLRSMENCFKEMVTVLKKDKYLCMVIGESRKHHKQVNDHLTSYLTENLQLELMHSTSREISQKAFTPPLGGVSTEEILIFRR